MPDGAGDNMEMVNPLLKPEVCARMIELMRAQCTATQQWAEWLAMPLKLAARGGDKELTKELVRAGASGDPVYEAIGAGQHDVVKHLQQEPEFHHFECALEIGDEAMMSLLLELGFEADPEDHWNFGDLYFTPIHLAAKAGQAGIVRVLMDAGACPDRRANEVVKPSDHRYDEELSGVIMTESALHFGAIGGHVDVIKEIIQREPLILNSTAESTGYTALHYAAKHSQLGCIDALVEAGADLEAEGGLGIGTALDSAVRFRHFEAARHLVSAGADVKEHLLSATSNRRLFSSECNSTQDDMFRALLGRGDGVNTKQASDGNTALHLAAAKGFSWKVELLLEAGADVTAVNHQGQTPLDVVESQPDRLTRFLDHDGGKHIRAMLGKARRDRAWVRRGFFVLCRAFPERVRLQLAPPQDDMVDGSSSAASHGGNDPLTSPENKKRAATAEGRGGAEGRPAAAHVEEGATAFRVAMGRLMVLEADVIFRKIVEFL